MIKICDFANSDDDKIDKIAIIAAILFAFEAGLKEGAKDYISVYPIFLGTNTIPQTPVP